MSADNQANNKRIAKNTLLLYFRMLLTMAVTLYTSRVVLKVLGVEDFGIYNVVGGVVAMFSFLNSAMTTSTQRYITFELGKGNFDRLKTIFSTCVNIHAIIAFAIILLVETVGIWFLYNKMVIPTERLDAAMWVLQISILTTVIAIMSFPYNADIIAHERMSAFAYISIIEVSLKLGIVFLLQLFASYDKLILYALLIAVVQLLICFSYKCYCNKHFVESKYNLVFDKALFKEMLSFAGWNLWGNLAAILFTQGLNMLLNTFFGPVVNAARGIAVQVQSAVSQFSHNFQTAINPQITKTYASGQLEDMHKLVFRSSKFTFMLLLILCLPIIIETPFILNLWLEEVPDYTSIFLRIILVTTIIDASANSLMVSAAATGEVKKYQSIIGGILLSIVPISYWVLKLGGQSWTVFMVHLFVCCIAFVTRLFIIKPMINLNIASFFSKVLIRCMFVVSLAILMPIFLHFALDRNILNSVIIIAVSFISAAIATFSVGIDSNERRWVLNKAKDLVGKFKK